MVVYGDVRPLNSSPLYVEDLNSDLRRLHQTLHHKGGIFGLSREVLKVELPTVSEELHGLYGHSCLSKIYSTDETDQDDLALIVRDRDRILWLLWRVQPPVPVDQAPVEEPKRIVEFMRPDPIQRGVQLKGDQQALLATEFLRPYIAHTLSEFVRVHSLSLFGCSIRPLLSTSEQQVEHTR